jgi:rhodanese-related sulfurtransferase
MNIVRRFLTIFLVSLLVGIIYNQLHPFGIHWRFLFPPATINSDEKQKKIKIISADSAYVLFLNKNVGFLDIRPPADFQIDHIEGAFNLPYRKIFEVRLKDSLSHDKWVIYDQAVEMDKLNKVALLLIDQDFKKVSILFGGYLEWLEKQYPIEVGNSF